MSGYIRWFLHHSHCGVEAPIPVPSPIQKGRIADLEGLPKGELKAAFLCPECGQIALYSDADLFDLISSTADPFVDQVLDLVSLRPKCVDSSCGLPVEIHVLWDVAKENIAAQTPISEWKVEEDVRCEAGHPPQLPKQLGQSLALYRGRMPF